MDKAAMFKLSYGVFLAGVSTNERKNACVINTAIQITDTPLRVSVTMQKQNLTHEMILEKGSLALTILADDCPIRVIGSFGFRSGRDEDKFLGVDCKFDRNGNPYLKDVSTSVLALEVFDTKDLGTHTMFFCEVADAFLTANKNPMTYELYRRIKSGAKPAEKTAENTGEKKAEWICSVCHYKYDGDIPFEELPDDYVCPVCKQPKSVFVKV